MIRVPMGNDSILCGTNEVNNGFWLGNRLALTSLAVFVESSMLFVLPSRLAVHNTHTHTHARLDCTDYTEQSTTLPYSTFQSSWARDFFFSHRPLFLIVVIVLATACWYSWSISLLQADPSRPPVPLHSRTQAKFNLIMINQGSLHRLYRIRSWSNSRLLLLDSIASSLGSSYSWSTSNKASSIRSVHRLRQTNHIHFISKSDSHFFFFPFFSFFGSLSNISWLSSAIPNWIRALPRRINQHRLKDDRSESEKTTSTLDAKARDHPHHNGKHLNFNPILFIFQIQRRPCTTFEKINIWREI